MHEEVPVGSLEVYWLGFDDGTNVKVDCAAGQVKLMKMGMETVV